MHVGEFWQPGKLLQALERVEKVIDSSVVDQITNTLSLLVNPDTLNVEQYDEATRHAIARKQYEIIKKLRKREMFVEISPTSNERISRFGRRVEGWQFQRLDVLIQRGLPILVTDDDPGIFETDLPLEFVQLYLGWTAYGPVGYKLWKRLLSNNEVLLERFKRRTTSFSPLSKHRPTKALIAILGILHFQTTGSSVDSRWQMIATAA
jgi:hypothetical protein